MCRNGASEDRNVLEEFIYLEIELCVRVLQVFSGVIFHVCLQRKGGGGMFMDYSSVFVSLNVITVCL